MPIVHVQILQGRSAEQKTRLMVELTETMRRCLDVDPERVQVQISEFEEGTWARGGVVLSSSSKDAR